MFFTQMQMNHRRVPIYLCCDDDCYAGIQTELRNAPLSDFLRPVVLMYSVYVKSVLGMSAFDAHILQRDIKQPRVSKDWANTQLAVEIQGSYRCVLYMDAYLTRFSRDSMKDIIDTSGDLQVSSTASWFLRSVAVAHKMALPASFHSVPDAPTIGGLVHAVPGTYIEDVAAIDLRSCYPSIIVACNMCITTCVPSLDAWDEHAVVKSLESLDKGDAEKPFLVNGLSFKPRTELVGLFPLMMEYLMG